MPLSAFQQPVISTPTTDFIEALAQNAISANYNLPLPRAKTPNWLIRAITLVAVQNLTYELWLFRSATNLTGAVATDALIGFWQFQALSSGQPGFTVTGDSLFHYYIDGLEIPYYDQDFQSGTYESIPYPRVHARLVNRSATGKNANATGAVEFTLWVSPQGLQGA